MRFTPMSEAEIKQAGLIPDGTYDFTVASAVDTESKKGNPMITVKLKIFVGDKERMLTDYLLEVMAWKLRHFCFSIGQGKAYEAGQISADAILGASGKVIIETEEAQDNWPAKNVVADYACEESKTQQKAAAKAQDVAAKATADADVPF